MDVQKTTINALRILSAEAIEKAGFDYLQIHGELKEEVLRNGTLPIIRAFNISNMKESHLLQMKVEGLSNI